MKKCVPALLLLVPLMIICGGCCSWTLRKVKRPRDGKPLGNRVAVVYSSRYQICLAGFERLHPFDIYKYARIYKALVRDGLLKSEDVYVPEPVSEEDILRVHTREFLESLRSSRAVAMYLEAPAIRYLPSGIVKRGVLRPFRYATGGTLLASRLALRYGIAINIGGGYHHAKPDVGEGFCVYADMPIAIRALQDEGKIRRALVIDLDVHQGNGTAVCLANDDATYTFSIHQGNIYPIPKAKSDLDVELAAGTGDEAYLSILSAHLDKVFEEAKPEIVFFQAGCDTLAGDPLASLKMTEEGIVRRDVMVIDACAQRNVPVVMTLGGGYSSAAWRVQFKSIRRIVRKYG